MDAGDGVNSELGGTRTVVVAVVKEAPLEGETPLIHRVVPEVTSKMKGRELDVDFRGSVEVTARTVSVVVLK